MGVCCSKYADAINDASNELEGKKLGTIYVIYCKSNSDLFYIGSTFQTLKSRWNGHKSGYKKYDNMKLYECMKNNGGIDNFNIEKLDCIICEIDYLRRLEGKFIQFLKSPLNKRIDGRTKTEYYIDNRNDILNNKKKYDNTHKQQKKQYNDTHKQQRKQYDHNRYLLNKQHKNSI